MNFDIVSTYSQGNIQALRTIKKISEIKPDDGVVTFRFRRYRENNPFNNLLIANSIRNFKKSNPELELYLIPKEENDFLCHLGFYDMIGVNFGRKIGEAQPSGNYVPITTIPLIHINYEDIDENARKLATLLSFDLELSNFLVYAFTETIRNVYEHAQINKVYICAQKWPTKSEVEISIVDTGCGIAEALGKRFGQKEENELLHLAIKAGISAQSNHKFLDKQNTWRNSGYGLYALTHLSVAYGGDLIICSGRVALEISATGIVEHETNFKGTAIALRIRTDQNINFRDTLSKIIEKGEKEAKNDFNAIKTASKSSGGNGLFK